MKFKVGDKVRIIKNVSGCALYDNDIGKIFTIDSVNEKLDDSYPYRLKGLIYSCCDEELELVEDIEVGDTVRIRKDITLEELPKNHWNGCQIETMDFLKSASHSDFDKEYKVTDVKEKWLRVKGYDLHINVKLFELVKKKEVKEMTIEEISEALGYEVKVVKGGK